MEANTPPTASSPDDNPIQDRVSARPRPQGPNVAPVVLGLVAMLLAALIIAHETMGWRIDWSQLGPGAIVGIGLLLVVLGVIGLVRRHDGP